MFQSSEMVLLWLTLPTANWFHPSVILASLSAVLNFDEWPPILAFCSATATRLEVSLRESLSISLQKVAGAPPRRLLVQILESPVILVAPRKQSPNETRVCSCLQTEHINAYYSMGWDTWRGVGLIAWLFFYQQYSRLKIKTYKKYTHLIYSSKKCVHFSVFSDFMSILHTSWEFFSPKFWIRKEGGAREIMCIWYGSWVQVAVYRPIYEGAIILGCFMKSACVRIG